MKRNGEKQMWTKAQNKSQLNLPAAQRKSDVPGIVVGAGAEKGAKLSLNSTQSYTINERR